MRAPLFSRAYKRAFLCLESNVTTVLPDLVMLAPPLPFCERDTSLNLVSINMLRDPVKFKRA